MQTRMYDGVYAEPKATFIRFPSGDRGHCVTVRSGIPNCQAIRDDVSELQVLFKALSQSIRPQYGKESRVGRLDLCESP